MALTCSTRATSADTEPKIRSGEASDATSVATRRSALCSFATRLTSISFASGSPSSAPSRLDSRSVRSMPVVTRPVSPINRFDHAISRRPPSFVRQCPTCGLDVPVRQTNARNSLNASRSSDGITKSCAGRPSTSARV